MPKPVHCKTCDSDRHYTYACFQNRKPIITKKRPKQRGKHFYLWQDARKEWIATHPPLNTKTYPGYWRCYLQISPDCLRKLDESTLTLDHVQARSRRPDLRYDPKNLKPCCSPCNMLKGSRSLKVVRSNDIVY